MKRFLVGLACLVGFVGSACAWDAQAVTNIGESRAVYFPFTTTAMTLYAVGNSTTSSVKYAVYADSIEVVTTDGIPFGTTDFVLADADKDTVGELITYLNAVSSTVIGCTFVATLPNGSYSENVSANLTEVGETEILETTSNLAGATIGYSYLLPAVDGKIFVSNVTANTTFGSGTTTITIYDGLGTGSILRKEKVTTTAVDKNMEFDIINSSKNLGIRFDIVGSAAQTVGYLNFTYKTK